MKKKILHVLNSSIYSGAENVAITIINNLKADFKCAYVSREGPIRQILNKYDIEFYPSNRISLSEIRRIVKIFKPDIIHAHDFTASIVCAMSVVGIPVISHLHNNSPWIKTYHLYSFAYLLSSIRYKKVLAVSSSVFDEYVFGKCIKKKSMVVSNPIDISFPQRKAHLEVEEDVAEYDMAFIGRLSPPKKISRFVDIVGALVQGMPSLKAVIIGDGELKDECIAQIKQLGLNENITLTGFIENPYKILSKAKVLCLTSEWEGFGLVAVEALSLGVPVVATAVGGLPGIVNIDCGKLCNSNGEFVVEIEQLLSDSSYWQMKSKGATQRAEELNNIEGYISKLREIYNVMLEQN